MNLASSSFHGVAIFSFARAYCVLSFSFHVIVVAGRCWILMNLASSTFLWFAISGYARACCMLSVFAHVVFGLCIRYITGPQQRQHFFSPLTPSPLASSTSAAARGAVVGNVGGVGWPWCVRQLSHELSRAQLEGVGRTESLPFASFLLEKILVPAIALLEMCCGHMSF